MEFNNYIDTKTPNDPMCEFQIMMLNSFFPLCKLLMPSVMPLSFRIGAFTPYRYYSTVCAIICIWEWILAMLLAVKVCSAHLMEELQPKPIPRGVSLSSEIQVWLDGLVCMTSQRYVTWSPCVRVTHLMLTLKVWPSHAWVHMCEACRLRCDTHACTHTIFISNMPSTPHLYPLDLIQLLCVCEKEQDTSSQEREQSNKTQSRGQWTFTQTSDQCINILAISYMHSLICITLFIC